jgi:hypothetical protein
MVCRDNTAWVSSSFQVYGPDRFGFRKAIRVFPGVISKNHGFWQIDNINVLYFSHSFIKYKGIFPAKGWTMTCCCPANVSAVPLCA